MPNSLSAVTRAALIRRLSQWTETHRRLALTSPLEFRKLLLLDRDPPQHLPDVIQPFQSADFAALDPAWLALARRGDARTDTSRLVRRAYIERPRGHSKTSDIAAQILWILLAADRSLSGLAAAADRDQAGLIYRAIRRLATINHELCGGLSFVTHRIHNPATGSQLEVISSDVASSCGALPDFVVCDELCHWERREMWESLLSSAAKREECVLTVLTNAGVGRGWQWDVREHARQSPQWHFSSLAGPHAPWISDAVLTEQRALLPAAVFERLWLNIWQHTDGTFVTLEEAEACRDARLSYQHEGRSGRAYVAAIDYAEKHDLTVGCVCHRDGVVIVVDRMDVVRPSPAKPTPVQWVEDWIESIAAAFGDVRFVIDAHQLVSTQQRLGERFRVERFEFGAGLGNHRLAKALHQLIVERRVRWYPGCGAIEHRALHATGTKLAGRDDLETELSALVVKESRSGRLRFDHRRDGVHHDDRVFALAVACLALCEESATPDFIEIATPVVPGVFQW
jgi:hypothetical protein